MNAARPGKHSDDVAAALAVAHRVAVLAETDPGAPLPGPTGLDGEPGDQAAAWVAVDGGAR